MATRLPTSWYVPCSAGLLRFNSNRPVPETVKRPPELDPEAEEGGEACFAAGVLYRDFPELGIAELATGVVVEEDRPTASNM